MSYGLKKSSSMSRKYKDSNKLSLNSNNSESKKSEKRLRRHWDLSKSKNAERKSNI